ncbi:MAG: hypothetical protein DRO87_10610 [Candidatus Thorarchaeota archaeon]|nr:MAG: hypothetical protein DRO87_10610 [Candidatus Thorarchaeota archaeon]RLI57177.1 MAG: hypothetical protein DRP09_04030 [Candidatus Thorarchaeota archaeon]
MVMVNLLLVNPMTNITMVVLWAGAGFVGGMIAGTKKGAFVVGLITWLSSLGIVVLCFYLLIIGGIDLGTIPNIPPGESLINLLSIPIFQDMLGQLLPLLSGMGGGETPDFTALLMPVAIWIVVPIVIVIIAGMIGATVRPKEVF